MMKKTTAAAAAAMLARLQPWVSALQLLSPPGNKLLLPFQVDDAVARVVWFNGFDFLQSPRSKTMQQSVCEGLSLLALLARVDPQACKIAVRSIWSASEELHEWMDSLPEQFEIGFELQGLSLEYMDSIKRLYDYNRSPNAPSEEYSLLRAEWEKELEDRDENDDNFTNIRVRLELETMDTDETLPMLRRTLKLIPADYKRRNASRRQANDPAPRFKVSHVAFASTIGMELPSEGLEVVREICSRKIRVSHVPPLSMEVEVDKMEALTRTIRQLTCLDGDPDHEPGVGTISINDQNAPKLIPALATAAQYSSKVYNVEIDIGSGDDDGLMHPTDLWTWVAYSIFSRHADHNISTLELNLQGLEDEDVEAVREVLSATNPIRALGGDDAPPHIVASDFMLSTDADGEFHGYFDAERDIAVRVLHLPTGSSIPWWSVILPGHGQAWVHADAVSSISSSEPKFINRDTASAPGFRTIDIAVMSDQSLIAAAELIGLIGHETERINLDELTGEDDAIDVWCERVLASCPQLKELQLGLACVNDLSLFSTAAAKGQCCLQRLYARIVRVDEEADGFRAFCDALSDPSHPLTQSLVSLDLYLVIEMSKPSLVIDPVLRMLRENHKLLKLHLRIVPFDELESQMPVYQSAFEEAENEVVSVRTKPLGIREKLAFLSVVHQTAHCAVGQLDTGILAIVLEFAAHGQARDVRFRYGSYRAALSDEDP